MTKVYVLCGVPGSGKTWVCSQLTDKFRFVAHDDDYKSHPDRVIKAALENSGTENRPVLTDCPFAERELRDKLEGAGFRVVPIFIVEPPEVVSGRYLKRTGKPLPQNSLTRAVSILNRAKEWKARHGTSIEIRDYLQNLTVHL
jgi:gluconate kinase